jgi:hypothetical protein
LIQSETGDLILKVMNFHNLNKNIPRPVGEGVTAEAALAVLKRINYIAFMSLTAGGDNRSQRARLGFHHDFRNHGDRQDGLDFSIACY